MSGAAWDRGLAVVQVRPTGEGGRTWKGDVTDCRTLAGGGQPTGCRHRGSACWAQVLCGWELTPA